jgi:hypothetical protein
MVSTIQETNKIISYQEALAMKKVLKVFINLPKHIPRAGIAQLVRYQAAGRPDREICVGFPAEARDFSLVCKV